MTRVTETVQCPAATSNAHVDTATHSVSKHFNNTPPESPCIFFCGKGVGWGLRRTIIYMSNFYDLNLLLFAVGQQGNWGTSRNLSCILTVLLTHQEGHAEV
jgi:hypothetical protein